MSNVGMLMPIDAKKEAKQEREARAALRAAILENPGLPVLTVMDIHIPCSCIDDGWDFNNRMVGSIRSVELDEYVKTRRQYTLPVSGWQYKFRSDDPDVEDTLRVCLPISEFEALDEKDYTQAYKSLPWQKAIVVHIAMAGKERDG